MKIIGKTGGGYLIEATERELAMASGFAWESEKEWIEHTKAARNTYSNRGELAIGAELQIRSSFEWLYSLRQKETTVRASAAIMRELASMMEAGVPSAIVPPPEQGKSGGD